jgi:hypothetical protein
VSERPELPPQQPEEEVLRSDEQTGDRIAWRVAEDEQASSVLRRRSEQPLIVRIAADHAVQHDYVGWVDVRRIGGDVVEKSLRPLLEARFAQEPRCLLLIGRRELEVDGPRGAAFQQLDLDLANSAADFEYGRALDSALLKKLDHELRRLLESFLSVPLCGPAGETRREEPVTAAGVAAARHSKSLREGPRPAVGCAADSTIGWLHTHSGILCLSLVWHGGAACV